MKGLKTTIVAVICLLLGLTIFVLWFIKKLDDSQLALGLASIGTFGSTLGLFFAKDANQSHSNLTGGLTNPDKEEK
mgnify:FL=1